MGCSLWLTRTLLSSMLAEQALAESPHLRAQCSGVSWQSCSGLKDGNRAGSSRCLEEGEACAQMLGSGLLQGSLRVMAAGVLHCP